MIFPTISLVVFVDDFTIEFAGTFYIVRSNLADAIDFVVKFFEVTPMPEVSATKSIIVGGTSTLARAVQAYSPSKKVSVARHGKLLGTPSGGGRRRVVKHLFD